MASLEFLFHSVNYLSDAGVVRHSYPIRYEFHHIHIITVNRISIQFGIYCISDIQFSTFDPDANEILHISHGLRLRLICFIRIENSENLIGNST